MSKNYYLASLYDFIKNYYFFEDDPNKKNQCLFDDNCFEKGYPDVYMDLLPKNFRNKCYEKCILNLNYNGKKGTLKSFPIIVEYDLESTSSDRKWIDLVSGDKYYESTLFSNVINSSLLPINYFDGGNQISKENVVKLLKMLDKNDVFIYRSIISSLNEKANKWKNMKKQEELNCDKELDEVIKKIKRLK